jgi:hypothetical protein
MKAAATNAAETVLPANIVCDVIKLHQRVHAIYLMDRQQHVMSFHLLQAIRHEHLTVTPMVFLQ